jgi:hypothetical protein
VTPEPPPIPPPTPPPKKAAGCLPIGLGVASFFPLLGVPLGLVAVVWGGITRTWWLVATGLGGILCTVVLYGSLFYFGFIQRGGVYDKLRLQLAEQSLNSTVHELEYYKLQHGHYPTTLGEITSSASGPSMPVGMDPLAIMPGNRARDPHFYYEVNLAGDHYFLRSVGGDGIPFTADDVLPTIPEAERVHTGLLLRQEEGRSGSLTPPTPSPHI